MFRSDQQEHVRWTVACRLFLLMMIAHSWAAPSQIGQPVSSGSTSCLKHCVCKWKGGKETVICHHQAGLTEVPALDTSVQVVDLSGNSLTRLTSHQFAKLGLTNLQKIILQRCSLRQIDPAALISLTNLVELDVSHNSLTTVPSGVFDGVPELRELKLSGNPLVRLPAQAFVAASKLIRLELANCQINVVEPRAFQGLELLEWLRLDGNLIESLPMGTFNALRSLRGVDLHHNPWSCTCLLRPLRSWLAARNMPFSIPPICLSPTRLRGQSWSRLQLEEFACPPRAEPVESVVKVAAGQQATLSCNVVSSPEAVVTWFYANRLIANLTTGDGASSAEHQVYFTREIGEKTNKTVQLVLNSTREQDSGSYVCQAVNRADKVTANFTLLVGAGLPGESASGHQIRGITAGIIMATFAILVVFLLVCCFCSLKRARLHASLRHRRPSAVFKTNGNSILSSERKLSDAHQLATKKTDATLTGPSQHLMGNGVAKPGGGGHGQNGESNDGNQGVIPHHTDKQWLVSKQPAPEPDDVKISGAASVDQGHRQIALYSNNKVTFDPEADDGDRLLVLPPKKRSQQQTSLTKSNSGRKVVAPHSLIGHNYPDVVESGFSEEFDGSDPQSDTSSVREDAEPWESEEANRRPWSGDMPVTRTILRRMPGCTSVSGPIASRRRRRLSDWEVKEFDHQLQKENSDDFVHHHWDDDCDDAAADLLLADEHITGGPLRRQQQQSSDWLARRRSDDTGMHQSDVDDDVAFHRRYAYHTDQLNRFLCEYRSLQKRLSQMQDTWSQCLEIDPSCLHRPPSSQRRPLRPILKKNRSIQNYPLSGASDEQREPLQRWASGEMLDHSTSVVERYYS